MLGEAYFAHEKLKDMLFIYTKKNVKI